MSRDNEWDTLAHAQVAGSDRVSLPDPVNVSQVDAVRSRSEFRAPAGYREPERRPRRSQQFGIVEGVPRWTDTGTIEF